MTNGMCKDCCAKGCRKRRSGRKSCGSFLWKPLRMDGATFGEMFTRIKGRRISSKATKTPRGFKETPATTWDDKAAGRILPVMYSRNNGYRSHWVQPSEKTLDAIRQWCIVPEYDSLTFEAIHWPDGRVLICCRNSLILGGIWLTILDADQVPAELARKEAVHAES